MAEHEWECMLVLEGHSRAVYSVSWGIGKESCTGHLGWLASTGSDGMINVWELSVRELHSFILLFSHQSYFI